MMKREIKFRAWDKSKKMIIQPYCNFSGGCLYYQHGDVIGMTDIYQTDFLKLMQYTGLKDKNGVEIYEGDLIRVKHKLGENEKWYVDAIYRVQDLGYEGFEMYCVKPVMAKDKNNQYPISSTLSFKYRSLCTDVRNDKYENLSIADSWGENRGKTWKENHYSNDVEVIGNIYSNPELISKEKR
jgi:uncharacterized phage protein (TIGR01671 family)